MGHPLIPPENAYLDEHQYRAIISALVHLLGGSVTLDIHDLEVGKDRPIRYMKLNDPLQIVLRTE